MQFRPSAFFCPCFQFGANALERAICLVAFESALPDDYQVPSGFTPCGFVAVVALDILRPLLHPERDIRFRHRRILASVSVPKATAHIDYRSCFRNHNVRLALESTVADSIPPAARIQPLAHKYLRQSVFAMDFRHKPAALFRSDSVHKCNDFRSFAQ